jgi:hypothetical protein
LLSELFICNTSSTSDSATPEYQDYKAWKVIRFKGANLNLGNGFDLMTSTFTAPANKAAYRFFLRLTASSSSPAAAAQTCAGIALFPTKERMAEICFATNSSGTLTTIQLLNKGDTIVPVFVGGLGGATYPEDPDKKIVRWTEFGGELLTLVP